MGDGVQVGSGEGGSVSVATAVGTCVASDTVPVVALFGLGSGDDTAVTPATATLVGGDSDAVLQATANNNNKRITKKNFRHIKPFKCLYGTMMIGYSQ